MLESLVAWKRESLYQAESDFVFASIRLKGKKLMGPDNLLKRYIRPALERAGIVGKVIGWYNFRISTRRSHETFPSRTSRTTQGCGRPRLGNLFSRLAAHR